MGAHEGPGHDILLFQQLQQMRMSGRLGNVDSSFALAVWACRVCPFIKQDFYRILAPGTRSEHEGRIAVTVFPADIGSRLQKPAQKIGVSGFCGAPFRVRKQAPAARPQVTTTSESEIYSALGNIFSRILKNAPFVTKRPVFSDQITARCRVAFRPGDIVRFLFRHKKEVRCKQ